MRRVAFVVMLLAALPTAAPAAVPARPPAPTSLVEVLRAFHLFGRWAVDCRGPAAPDNPYVSDEMPSPGVVLESQELGPDAEVNRYRIVAAARLSATRLSLQVIFRPDSDEPQHQHLILLVRDGTRRTMFNKPAGEPVRVQDGVAVGYGVPTPLLKKCE